MAWWRSLQGQTMLAIAAALLVAQGLSASLIWHEVHQRRIATLVNGFAMRMLDDRAPAPATGVAPNDARPDWTLRPLPMPPSASPDDSLRLPRALRVHIDPASPAQPGDRILTEIQTALRDNLVAQGEAPGALLVVERDADRDPLIHRVLPDLRIRFRLASDGALPPLVVAAKQRSDGSWITVRGFLPSNEGTLLLRLLRQAVLTYLVLVGVVGLILRRITRPLRALTAAMDRFAAEPGRSDPLQPQGPDDIQHLIVAHNAMQARLCALLDEKDVMLGAIGHDLKTPLATLRVRIEAVADDAERARMAATIEDINRSLDDILSLARVGRPSDPVEPNELAALVADIVGEYEDMGEDVTLVEAARTVAPVRATWLRRALRNLVSNALRYGTRARIHLHHTAHEAVLVVEDDGPGIAPDAIARMMEPFTRLDVSRNSATGGAGLGLTLARAIADQHGGSLVLANRMVDGRVAGLNATLRLPLH
jgi:signal transduction histidine kinase